MKAKPARRAGRVALLALAMISLFCGVWGGLIRLPLALPLPSQGANWISFHGPVMVCGFLGTVISLERAVGLGAAWTYIAPLLTATGSMLMLAGMLGAVPPAVITAGSAAFVLVTGRVVQLQRALFTVVMAAAAVAWLCGNGLWLEGWAFNRVLPWWVAFLALTIIGERLDLSRFQKPSPWSKPLLYAALLFFVAGVMTTALLEVVGERLTGAGMLALALWLARFDIARRTVRQPGLPRFMALCLLPGYGWLALAGIFMSAFAPLESGLRYDAVVHAFFVGFVFSMIFGHAPVIFPAVLQLNATFRRRFYVHVIMLHLALALRVAADLAGWAQGRQWGGIGNALAMAVFLLNTVTSMASALLPRPADRDRRG